MAAKSATLEQVMELIREGQASARERHEDLKTDFETKHTENRERRHAIMNKLEAVENRQHNLETRTGALETQMVSIVGDNSGGSGLLHKMDKALDTLKEEVASIKQTVQNTPAINRWIYGAMGIVAFLIVVVPTAIFILFEIIKLIAKH